MKENLSKTKKSFINNANDISLEDFAFSPDISSAIRDEIEDSIRRDVFTKLWLSLSNNDESILAIMNEVGKDKVYNNHLNHKETRSITNCKHINKKHYAKGMCYNCYHRQGRNKKAWVCTHSDKPHYAKGLCNSCYQV